MSGSEYITGRAGSRQQAGILVDALCCAVDT